jgi:hypothetical protein
LGLAKSSFFGYNGAMGPTKRKVGRPPKKEYGQIKSIRFDEKDQERMRALANLWRCSEAAAVRRAVAIAAQHELPDGGPKVRTGEPDQPEAFHPLHAQVPSSGGVDVRPEERERKITRARGEAQAESDGRTPAPARETLTPEERAARANAALGAFAHVPGSVEEFLRRKQEEIDLEEERSERRRGGRTA